MVDLNKIQRSERSTAYSGLEQTPTPPKAEPSKIPAKASQMLLDIFDREVEKINDMAVNEADLRSAQLETELLHTPRTGAMNLQGKSSIGSYSPTMENFDTRSAEIINSLSNDAQKNAARKRLGARRATMDRKLQAYISKQTAVYDNNNTKLLIEAERRGLSNVYGSPTDIGNTIGKMHILLDGYADRNLLDDKWLEDAKQKVTSDSYKKVISLMIAEGNDQKAQEFYDANDEDIYDKENIIKELKTASTDGLAAREVMKIVGEMGPRDDSDAFEIDKMAQRSDSILPDEKSRKAARTLFKERKSLWDAGVEERETANLNALNKARLAGAPIEALVASTEYRNLNETAQLKFRADVARISPEDRAQKRIEQELNFSRISTNPVLLRESNIDRMLNNQEISPGQHKSLNILRDPKKQPDAISAFKWLRDARSQRLFNPGEGAEAKADNEARWVEYNNMLHSFLENNPDGDPSEFVQKIMEPVNNSWMDWFSDIGSFGQPGTLAAEERKRGKLRERIGQPKMEVEEGEVFINRKTGERKKLVEGVWVTI